jgi:hypothetical protein
MTNSNAPRPPTAHDLASQLSRLNLGALQEHEALSLWPIVSPVTPAAANAATQAPPYVGLAEAIAAGRFRVEEVDEHGAVENIVAVNEGDACVLILFGEELRGAKQNRIANASFLVGPHSRTVIDVSCVEQGRWARRTRDFEASGAVFSSQGRRKMAKKVARAVAEGGRFDADQHEVWSEVGSKLMQSGAHSETLAYADHLQERTHEVGRATQDFDAQPHQVGFVAAVRGQIRGLEIIGRPEVFARSFSALLGAYLIDAIDDAESGLAGGDRWRPTASESPSPGFVSPEAFLEAVAKANTIAGPSLGLGEDLRLRGDALTGCALFAGELVHLTAFAESSYPDEIVN